MHIHLLSSDNSILNHFLAEIRDVEIQKDSMRFRKNIERIGEIMAYEISKALSYTYKEVETPLGTKKTALLKTPVVLCSILRAGLALHQGFMNLFDHAENAFVSASRHHISDDSFEIRVEYLAVPLLSGKNLIIVDPMLATGHSMLAVIEKLLAKQKPKELHLAVVIAAPEGIDFLRKMVPESCHLWVASLDDKLNKKNYILPGLGDAGDLAYGNKIT